MKDTISWRSAVALALRSLKTRSHLQNFRISGLDWTLKMMWDFCTLMLAASFWYPWWRLNTSSDGKGNSWVTYLSIWMSFLPIYFQNEWETSYNNVYPHNGTLFSNKRERQADRRSKTDQVQKHAMQKKLETKDHILHNSVHRKCPEKTNT